jgi:hypothetical protein
MGRRARGNRKTSQPGFEEVVKVFVSLPEEDGGRDPRGPGKEAGMRKGVWYGLLTGLALLLAACGGQPPPSLTLAQPDLTLAGISPQNPAVVQGETVTLTLTFTSQNGFQGQVSSSVLEGGQPVSWLSPNAVQRNLNVPRGQQVQETLEVQVDPDAPTGSQNLTVRAAYGNQVTERDLTLTVSAGDGDGEGDGDGDGEGGGDGRRRPRGDFTISLSSDSLTVQQGASGTTQLTLTPQNGFTGGVRLALVAGRDRVPRGLTLSPRSVRVSGTSPVNQSLTLSARRTTPPGTYRLKVRATSRRLTREADLTLTVSAPGGGGSPDFTIYLNPTSLTVQQGSSGTTQLTLTPQNGFTGTVNLSLVGAPSGVTLSPTSVNVTGSGPVTQNLTVNVGSGVATGTYNLQVRATGGSLTKTANLTLTVSGPGTIWTRRTSGTFETLYGVTYSGDRGLFVALGTNGTILTSPDGVSWTRQTSGTGYALQGVTYGNGTFVAVGSAGTILTSPDGVNWMQRTSGTTESLYGVTYSNGTFVAVGGYGIIRTSPDGVAWTGRFSGTRNWIYNVTYGNGKFVAVEGGDAFIISLDNGFSWTRRTAGIAPPPGYSYVGLGGVTYGNGKFVAVGNRATILTSPDGETWTQQDSGASTINNLFSVTYGNGTFVAVGEGGIILTSP